MAISDISLTSGMRGSLLSLQGNAKSIDRTQERLSTGRKVNTALDNPTNFFASQAHLNRAGDLNSRKDSIKEAIQNINAANSGITAISSLLSAANGLANAALGTNVQADRNSFSKQFDELLNQIDTLASDSGYRGTNMLKSDALTVNFAESSGSSSLTIAGVDATSTGLGVVKTTTGTSPSNSIAVGGLGFIFGSVTLAINNDGTVSADNSFGFDPSGIANVPAGLTDVVAVKAGERFALALKSDGTVMAWGDDSSGGVSGAAGLSDVTSIAVGRDFALALKSDGTVVAWGANFAGQTDVPAGLTDVVAISAGPGANNALALKSDGTVVAWGDDPYGVVSEASTITDVTAIATGGFHAVAIKADTSVVAWGSDNAMGQLDIPAGLTGVTALAAGVDYTLALKNDGTVVAWGRGATVPTGFTDVVGIAAGENTGMALKKDGTVVSWDVNFSASATLAYSGINIGSNWTSTAGIQTSQDQINEAITQMRSNAKSLASNSTILTTRLDFTSSLTNILQTGADNLTLADMNEEGASMLMLQTRQSLGTNSLSMAAQASQSVMRLF